MNDMAILSGGRLAMSRVGCGAGAREIKIPNGRSIRGRHVSGPVSSRGSTNAPLPTPPVKVHPFPHAARARPAFLQTACTSGASATRVGSA